MRAFRRRMCVRFSSLLLELLVVPELSAIETNRREKATGIREATEPFYVYG